MMWPSGGEERKGDGQDKVRTEVTGRRGEAGIRSYIAGEGGVQRQVLFSPPTFNSHVPSHSLVCLSMF